MHRGLMLGVFLLLCFGVAGISSWITSPQISDWYATISKPAWTPPSWVFGPVWTTLYAMMAVAGWRIWLLAPSAGRTWALGLFAIQLALNFAWSPTFFALHRLGLSVGIIVALWLAIGGFVIAAWPLSRTAAWLFVPYWVWVSFASALNLAIWRLNR